MRRTLPPAEIEQIINKICGYYLITKEEVLSKSRHEKIVEARHHIFFEMRKRRMSHPQISKIFYRDPTTVVCAMKKKKQFPDLFTDRERNPLPEPIITVTPAGEKYLDLIDEPTNQGKDYADYMQDQDKTTKTFWNLRIDKQRKDTR